MMVICTIYDKPEGSDTPRFLARWTRFGDSLPQATECAYHAAKREYPASDGLDVVTVPAFEYVEGGVFSNFTMKTHRPFGDETMIELYNFLVQQTMDGYEV